MQQDDKAWAQAEDRGRAADLRAGVCAAVCAFVAIGLLSVNAGFMYSRQDKRIILTTLDVFHDWAGLQGVFRKATSYDPRFNPPSLDYFGKFDGGSVNLDVLQDLLTRGLVSEQRFANYSALFNRTTGEPLLGMADPRDLMELSSAFFSKFLGTVFFNVAPVALSQPVVAASPHFMDPRLLVRLQRISRCSFPDAVAGTTPVTRSPGCACIADTYLRFVRATANMTGNVTAAARGEAADRVVRCMDKRVTLRSWGAGSVWTIHPVALAFYSSGVFFLVCTAYLLSYYHYELFPADWSGDMRVRVIQGILVGLTGVLVLILVLHAPLANGLQAVGLVLSLSTFVFSARGVLNHPSEEQGQRVPFKPEPHPLTVCFWLNLPLLIPGPLIGVLIGGYTRDVYAVWTMALVGAVIGIILMRVFWYVWNDDHKFAQVVLPPMALALLDLVVLVFVWLVVYRSTSDVYALSHLGFIVGSLGWLAVLIALLYFECHVVMSSKESGPSSMTDLNQRFEDGEHSAAFLVTAAFLLFFTIFVCIDSQKD